jgi:hypothetical protein
MARPQSRPSALRLAFAAVAVLACIALGVGAAMMVGKVNPALLPVTGLLALAAAAILNAVRRKRARDRVAHRADDTEKAAE